MRPSRPTALLAMVCGLLTPIAPGRVAAAMPEPVSVGSITSMTEPMTRQVVQRRDNNVGLVLFVGTYSGEVDGFQVCSTLEAGMSGTPLGWTALVDVSMVAGHFYGILKQPAGGFYDFQIRPVYQGRVGSAVAVDMVGVGEVFITAGQSNTTNWGTPTGTYPNAMVSAFDDGTAQGLDVTYPGASWQWGCDPQPAIDQSNLGSVWPTMATNLSYALGVPIGLYAVGCGGTSIVEWTPGYVMAPTAATPQMVLFDRLTNAIKYFTSRGGVRAVLWQQGENDYYDQTSGLIYGADLRYIIDQSRAVTGVPIKWMVAQTSSPLTDDLNERLQLEVAQLMVVDYALTFPGPNADYIGLPFRRYLGTEPVHFNAPGLVLMGGFWGIYVYNVPGFLNLGFLPPG